MSERVFTEGQAAAVAKLHPRRVARWVSYGLVSPSVTRLAGHGRERVYSWDDLVSLTIVADLSRGALIPAGPELLTGPLRTRNPVPNPELVQRVEILLSAGASRG